MLRPWSLVPAVLAGCVASSLPELPPDPDAPVAGEAWWSPPPPPLYSLRIRGIATSDTNGANASPVTAAKIAQLLPELNEIFGRSRIQIAFDPATDFETRASTLLNQRFGVIGNLTSYTDPDSPPPTTTSSYDAARRAAADEQRDKITIVFAAPLDLAFSSAQGHWVLVPDSGGGSSGRFGRWVSWKHGVDAPSLAHEIGHYLHNQHPFVEGVATKAAAAARIAAYINAGNPVADGLLALDGDRGYVLDTAPDAAGSIFVEAYGDKCGPAGSIDIPVTYGAGQQATFTLAPDRDLVMSYFKGCGFDNRFSADQTVRLMDSLTLLNRRGVLRYLGAAAPSATPTLAWQGDAIAGDVTQVKIARIGVRRVVTATTGTSTLKLIVWDVAASGAITRRGEIVVGDVGGRFEVTHGGLGQVIVAFESTSGSLGVRTYRVSSAGSLTLQDSDSAGGITDLALARVEGTRFVTPVRLATGALRVIAWQIDADGSITRLAHADGAAVDSIEAVTAYHPAASGSERVEAAATIFARAAGDLAVQTWKVRSDPWAVVLADSDGAGDTAGAAASELDFGLAASVVRTGSSLQKVIAWTTSYFGTIARGGSFTTTMPCNRVASAAIGTRFLATACRRDDLKQDIRLFEVSPDGATVTQRHEQYYGTAVELAMAAVGADQVVIATRSSSNALYLRAFGLAP